MPTKMAAPHTAGKILSDAIFGASAAANEATAKHGAAAVTNATIGAIMDESEKLACIKTMEEVYRSLPMTDIIAYAPIAGLSGYLDAVTDLTFAAQRPGGFTAACATAGGTGAIHHAIANYSAPGDEVLTSDWFWGPYSVLCREQGRRLSTYSLFDEKLNFNLPAFTEKAASILKNQDSLLVIINTPAHNPTGYSLSETDWEGVLHFLKDAAKSGKRISILIDIAYIDYAGEKEEARAFMRQLGGLPEGLFVMFAFSMSKGYTMYGQRTGAIVGLSPSREVIEEFSNVAKFSSRATWSNINRGAMTVLTKIQQDPSLLARFEAERADYYRVIKERGAIFMGEAESSDLVALPYKAGFFLSIPSADPKAVCDKLHDDLIYAVPLKKGVRIAVCSVPKAKMHGMAEKVKRALEAVG